MSEPLSTTPASAIAPLSQFERVGNIFTAPSKTFTEIANGRRSWWLPFVIALLFSYLFFAVVTVRVGWNQVAENALHMNAKTEEKLAQAPPAQREQTLKITQYSMEGGFIAAPVSILLVTCVVALILWGTINFGFGGKATFGGVFAVSIFASLPGVIKTLLGTLVTFFAAPDSFNIANFAPTNLGAFLSPTETNVALYKLATALDFTTIWSVVLTAIGLAAVARVKRSAGYIAVFGWWGLMTLVGIGWAVAFN